MGLRFFPCVVRTRVRWIVAGFAAALAAAMTAGTSGQSRPPVIASDVLASSLQDPAGVAVDEAGAIFVSEGSGRITRLAPGGARSVLLDGLEGPAGILFDRDGVLFIVEERGGRVLRREPSGALTVVASGLARPRWLAADSDGTLYVTARGWLPAGPRDVGQEAGGQIVQISPSGSMTTFVEGLRGLEGIALAGRAIHASVRRLATDLPAFDGARLVQVPIRADGTAGPIEPLEQGGRRLGALAVDRLGALFAATTGPRSGEHGSAVLKRLPAGDMVTAADGLRNARGMTFDEAGNLLVADAGRLLRYHAPPAPLVAAPAFTNQSPHPLGGRAQPGDLVQAFAGDDFTAAVASAVADTSPGAFTLLVPLAPNSAAHLSFVATADGGRGLSSASVTRTLVHDDRVPAVALIDPPAGVHVRDVVSILARAEDPGSGVESIVFTLDDDVAATVENPDPAGPHLASMQLDTRGASEGAHSVGAVAADRAGNTAQAARQIVVDRTPPETRIVSGPGGDVAGTTATFVLDGEDLLSPSLTFAWRIDGGPWSPFEAASTISVEELSPGVRRFEAKARDLAGNEDPTPADETFTVTALRVRITEPTDGTIVTTETTWVRGTVESGPAGAAIVVPLPPDVPVIPGVTFHSVPAGVEHGTFAVEVPLVPSMTEIAVVATDLASGVTSRDSVGVTVQLSPAAPSGRLRAYPDGGLAPLVVRFSAPLEIDGHLALDLEGDGMIDFDGPSLADLPFFYAEPGIYLPSLRVTAPDGRTVTYRTSVEVYDAAALEARLQAVWRGFNAALRSGNVAEIVAFIHSGERAYWADALSRAGPDAFALMEEVPADVHLVSVGAGGAECEVLQMEDGQVFSYPVVFVVDIDGRWLLWQF